jgi:hypothetical protein
VSYRHINAGVQEFTVGFGIAIHGQAGTIGSEQARCLVVPRLDTLSDAAPVGDALVVLVVVLSAAVLEKPQIG